KKEKVQYGKVKGLGGDILGIPLKSQVESVEIEQSWDKQCLAILKGEDTASESVEEKVEKDMVQWLEREGRTIDTVLELAKVQSVELVEESFFATLFKAEMRQMGLLPIETAKIYTLLQGWRMSTRTFMNAVIHGPPAYVDPFTTPAENLGPQGPHTSQGSGNPSQSGSNPSPFQMNGADDAPYQGPTGVGEYPANIVPGQWRGPQRPLTESQRLVAAAENRASAAANRVNAGARVVQVAAMSKSAKEQQKVSAADKVRFAAAAKTAGLLGQIAQAAAARRAHALSGGADTYEEYGNDNDTDVGDNEGAGDDGTWAPDPDYEEPEVSEYLPPEQAAPGDHPSNFGSYGAYLGCTATTFYSVGEPGSSFDRGQGLPCAGGVGLPTLQETRTGAPTGVVLQTAVASAGKAKAKERTKEKTPTASQQHPPKAIPKAPKARKRKADELVEAPILLVSKPVSLREGDEFFDFAHVTFLGGDESEVEDLSTASGRNGREAILDHPS
ncbi:hypothetical protein B484DRAFT_471207, partial [Ochromonadaceae sp. CCMP2298]